MAPAPVVAGVAEHNGWAVFVCLGVKDGSPEVVDRRRVELIERGLPNQPYEHNTVGMSSTEAERAILRLKSEHDLVSMALRTEPLPKLPASVAEVHASWYLHARADAILYHDALCTAAATLGIGVAMFPKGKERPQAAEAMATTAEALDAFFIGLRTTLGPPWQQDHQAATARAIAALLKRSGSDTLTP